MVSQRTVAQDANHIAGYEGYPKPSKRTERLLIFSSARGAKRDHESETTPRSSWILGTMVTPAKVSLSNDLDTRNCAEDIRKKQ